MAAKHLRTIAECVSTTAEHSYPTASISEEEERFKQPLRNERTSASKNPGKSLAWHQQLPQDSFRDTPHPRPRGFSTESNPKGHGLNSTNIGAPDEMVPGKSSPHENCFQHTARGSTGGTKAFSRQMTDLDLMPGTPQGALSPAGVADPTAMIRDVQSREWFWV